MGYSLLLVYRDPIDLIIQEKNKDIRNNLEYIYVGTKIINITPIYNKKEFVHCNVHILYFKVKGF